MVAYGGGNGGRGTMAEGDGAAVLGVSRRWQWSRRHWWPVISLVVGRWRGGLGRKGGSESFFYYLNLNFFKIKPFILFGHISFLVILPYHQN